MALQITNQETKEPTNTMFESSQKLSADCAKLIKSNESLKSETGALRGSNDRLKTSSSSEKQEPLQITAKAEFNKFLEVKLQEVKSQNDAQLKDLKSKDQSLEEQINSIMSSQRIRWLTTLLDYLAAALQLQEADEWHAIPQGRRLRQ
ncbi:hypothetical protein ACHAPA_003955 [Fusarium lateritium]